MTACTGDSVTGTTTSRVEWGGSFVSKMVSVLLFVWQTLPIESDTEAGKSQLLLDDPVSLLSESTLAICSSFCNESRLLTGLSLHNSLTNSVDKSVKS